MSTKNYFDDTVAKEILQDIQKEFGLDYTKQEYITLRKMERFALKHQISNFTQLQKKLLTSSLCKEQLINMLTVGESYFYRERGHLKILQTLIQKEGISKILCAPSSSGEEVYSILLALKEAYLETDMQIIGIDINSELLAKAKIACYSQRSLSCLSPSLIEKYFISKEQRYCLCDSIKASAKFQRENVFALNDLLCLGKFDVIFCRNMLIYFNEEQKKEAIYNLSQILKTGAYLFFGHADISFTPKGFKKIISNDGSYFQKISYNNSDTI